MKKSFKELVKKMESLQENQQGKLKGGFSSFSSKSSHEAVLASNINNVSSCVCNESCSPQ